MYKMEKKTAEREHYSVSLARKFFLLSSTVFLFLNSEGPLSLLTKELMGAPVFFSANLMRGSSGTGSVRAN